MILAQLIIQTVVVFHYYMDTGGDPSLYLLTVSWMPLLPAALFVWTSRATLDPLPAHWTGAFGFFLFVFFLGAFMGLFSTVEPQHYLGDIAKFAIPWADFYLTIRAGLTLLSRCGPKALEPFSLGFVGVSLADGLQTLFIGFHHPGQHVSTNLFFLALAWGLLQNRYSSLISLPIAGLCIKAALFSHKRSNVVVMLITLSTSLIFLIWKKRRGRLVSFFLGVLVMGFLNSGNIFSTFEHVFNGNSNTLQRFGTVLGIVKNNGANDTSFHTRVNEDMDVLDFLDKNPQYWLTGIGFGGEIPAPYPTGNMLPDGNIHHVHSAIYVFLLRNGVIGLVFLGFFMVTSLGMAKGLSGPNSDWVAIFLIISLNRMVGVNSGNYIISGIDILIFTGMCSAYAFTPHRQGLAVKPSRLPLRWPSRPFRPAVNRLPAAKY
jgi:hypothetical protein